MENNSTLQNFYEVSQIVLYKPEEDVVLEVKLDKNTIWLSQQQIADLFGVQKSAISKHMKNIFGTGELVREQVVSKMETTASDGKRYKVDYYNLDLILSVGYRVNSRNATQFRIWATSVLRDYLLRGYSINHQLVAMQERIDTRFSKLEERVSKNEEQINFFIRTNVPPVEGIFYEGQVLDARLFAEQLIRIAKREVILIDNYIDSRTFDILEYRNQGVDATIYVERIGRGLQALQSTAQTQSGRLVRLAETRQRVHDRFLIIDDEVYHLGASLNELGKRLFAFSRLQMSKSVILCQVRSDN